MYFQLIWEQGLFLGVSKLLLANGRLIYTHQKISHIRPLKGAKSYTSRGKGGRKITRLWINKDEMRRRRIAVYLTDAEYAEIAA